MGISISNLLSHDIVLSITVASIVSLLSWFILIVRNNNKKNKEHDKELFKQPPAAEDCPICFLRMPSLNTGYRYQTCCGKVICSGCYYAPVYDNQGNEVDNEKCPFCRSPFPTSEEMVKRMIKRMEAGDHAIYDLGCEIVERLMKRVEMNDPIAIHDLGCCYRDEKHGFTQDHAKALELYHMAGELGHTTAHCNIGYAYNYGQGVEVDMKKANHYYKLSAIGGCTQARYNLGNMEVETGNMERALKHYMIAAENGDNDSLKEIQDLYSGGHATKNDYAKALLFYQAYLREIKSVQRDKAAADDEGHLYY